MKITVHTLDNPAGVIVEVLSDNLDASNAKAFKDAMQDVIQKNNLVILNLQRLEFVDSSGLGALLSALRSINDKEGELRLFGMTKPVQALFELVRMYRLFAIYGTQEEAIAA